MYTVSQNFCISNLEKKWQQNTISRILYSTLEWCLLALNEKQLAAAYTNFARNV